MKIDGIAARVMLALFGLASCNFDAALKRYCDNNPNCHADAGPTLEVGFELGLEVEPEVGLEVGPEAGLEVGLEVGQGGEVSDAEFLSPIPPPKNCTSSNDCSSPDEFCSPLGQVCVKTCNGPADCPPWLGSCSDTRGGPTRGPKVCSCTFQSCNNYSNVFTCNPSAGLCERACGNDQDCSGFPPRICDLPTGLCKAVPQTCSVSSDCPSEQPRCDATSLVCSGCLSSTDCTGRSDGFSQCSQSGSCVGPPPGN